MTKEQLRKTIVESNGLIYNPAHFDVDWQALYEEYCSIPGEEKLQLTNENMASFYNEELVAAEVCFERLFKIMENLETDRERWYWSYDRVYRECLDNSKEGTSILEGIEGEPIERWIMNLFNKIIDYREELEMQRGIKIKGEMGEDTIEEMLDKSKFSKYSIHNIVLGIGDEYAKTNEIDTYVITSGGIAVLETKNYGKRGQTLVINEDEDWEIRDSETFDYIKSVKNPMFQNTRHANATRRFLDANSNQNVNLYPVIVIANNAVDIVNETSIDVLQPKDLMGYLNSINNGHKLDDDYREQLRILLEEADIGARTFTAVSYRKSIEAIKEFVEKIRQFLIYNQQAKTYYYKKYGNLDYVKDNVANIYAIVLAIICVLLIVILQNIWVPIVVFCAGIIGYLVVAGVVMLIKSIMGLLKG